MTLKWKRSHQFFLSKTNYLSKVFIGVAFTLTSALTQTATAQSDYPNRAIELTSPFSPGGDADTSARTLSRGLDGILPEPIVVQNRSGASGMVGSLHVLNSKPDGYNLLLARVGPHAILPALLKNKQYEWDDFTVLGILDI